jgi:signal transduction histidine kinase
MAHAQQRRESSVTEGARYRLWPRFAPSSVAVTEQRQGSYVYVALLIVAGVFWVPAVRVATGIPAVGATALVAAYTVWVWVNQRVLWDRARREPRAFHVLLAGDLVLGVAVCLGLYILGNDPKTPLVALFCVYAAFNGAMHEVDASFGFLVLHAATPLLAIPFFLAAGADPAWTVAAPVMTCGFSAMAYHYMAMRADLTRTALRERDEERLRLRALEAETERRQLARDLHDSVGSALSLFGLCGDLIQRHRDAPLELDRIAVDLRDSARDGLGELRGVLDAMAPVVGDLEGVGSNLRRAATRLSAASGASVELTVAGEGTLGVDGAKRVALVRVFQEATSNALRHGRAQAVRASLRVDESVVILVVADDGVGFDPAATHVGRGLPGMRSRARDLGGSLDVQSRSGDGASVTLRLPLA